MDTNTLLMMQLLSGLGSDLSAYGANTDKGLQFGNTTGAINQIGSAAMFNKMLKDSLGPNANKMSMGSNGITLKVAPGTEMYNMLLGNDQGTQPGGPFEGLAKPWDPNKPQGGGQNSVANPFYLNL